MKEDNEVRILRYALDRALDQARVINEHITNAYSLGKIATAEKLQKELDEENKLIAYIKQKRDILS